MIRYISGDLFKGNEEILIHGCNCYCCMGAGVALYVKKYYPEAYTVDKQTKYGDKNKLGNFTYWFGKHHFYHNKNITIVNAYTQYAANESLKPFDYVAFSKFLTTFKNTEFYSKSISLPKIGSGLAGGNWNKIETMINNVWNDKEIYVYVL